MAQVHNLFSAYKECISTFNQREADFTNLIQEASPPQAKYVPTVAVHNNLALIQQRSTSSVWENAPPSVCSPAGTPSSGYRPPTLPTNLTPNTTPLFPNVISQLSQKSPQRLTTPDGAPKKKHQIAMDPIPELDLTDETATTHSQMTKSMNTQNKFAEIEASIRRHQQVVTQHQADLAQVNERALFTLTLVEETAADVQQLTEHTTEQLTTLRNEIRQEAGFARMMDLIQQLTAASADITTIATVGQPAARSPDNSYHSDDESEYQDTDTMSAQTIETDNHSSIAASPVKKKRKSRDSTLDTISKNLNPTPPSSDQDQSAHYNHPRTPDDGET